MVNSVKNGKVDDLPKIFNTLELLMQEGNEKARELVIVGLIENIQNQSSGQSFNPDVFKKWLKEESLKSWNEIEKYWEGKTNLADVIREENTID